ncbi:MAG: lysylphosphatidylglycerol synthase domain-containing protein [Caldilineaceae bacterium]
MLDRLIGLISLALMAAVALVISFSTVNSLLIRTLVLGAIGGLLIGWMLFFHKPLIRKLLWVIQLPLVSRVEQTMVRYYHTLYGLHSHKQLLLTSVVVSVLLQVIEVTAVMLIARSLSVQVPALYFFLFMPLIWLITMIPLSLNGLGLREGAFAFFFGLIGVAAPEAISISLLVYSCRLLSSVVGGILYAYAAVGRQLQPSLSKTEFGKTGLSKTR